MSDRMRGRRPGADARLVERTAAQLRDAIAAYVAATITDALRTTRDAIAAAPRATAPTSASFLDRLIAEQARMPARLERVARDYRLSPREAQLLAAGAYGIPRARFAEVFGTSENTIKTQLRMLLEKLGQRTADDAAWWIRDDAPIPPRGRRRSNRRRRRRPSS
jgi:DNA-binding CsgD family transcriptional regulator